MSRNARWSWLIALMLAPWLSAPVLAQPATQRTLEPVVRLQVPGGPAQTLYDASYALVIGASNYTNGWGALPGVPGDVKAVSALLARQGFQVSELLDPTRDQLDRALRNFVAQRGLREGNRLLVYFAGHGHTLRAGTRRLGYIVPVDAPNPNRDPAGFREKAYSMESIEVHARQIEARHALFVFDSCFSGTIFRTRSGVPDAITDRTAKPVRQFITAGDEDQVVPDESVFRRQLERGLGEGDADLNRDGYITGTELGDFLQDQVTNYTRRAQTPRHGKIRDQDLDRGDFVFLAPRVAQQVGGTAPGPGQAVASIVPEAVQAPSPRPAAPAVQSPPVAPPPAASLQPGEVVKDCDVCPRLVVIPGGRFMMGSPANEPGRDEDEGPQRTVEVRSFLLGQTEVTQGQWKAVMGSNPSGFKDCGDECPVERVSWNDAQEYVRKLSERTGKRYRLPSEAEWEYAARAGSVTAWSFGNEEGRLGEHGWFNGNGGSKTQRVGSRKANAWSLYDMHGNVDEWVQDVWHDNYAGGPTDGSAWMTGGDQARRVLRGGSWVSSPQGLRSAYRLTITPANRFNSTGFRIARTF